MAFSKLKAWFREIVRQNTGTTKEQVLQISGEISLLPGEWLEIVRQNTGISKEQVLQISEEARALIQKNHSLAPRLVEKELLMQNKVLRERDRYIGNVHAMCLRDLRSLVTDMEAHGADSDFFKHRCKVVGERMDAGRYDLKI